MPFILTPLLLYHKAKKYIFLAGVVFLTGSETGLQKKKIILKIEGSVSAPKRWNR
jgi:hypothetical protein